MIRLSGVSVSLGGRPILTGVDLDVERGSWTCLIGPNGSGKTTLLRAVAGLVPFSGEILAAGGRVGKLSARTLARTIASVPQNPVVPQGMSVGEYVLLGRTPHLPYLGGERAADIWIASRALGRVGLEQLANRTISTLSGGELQRAVLARALVQQPRILLLDEPTSGLDLGHQQEVLELVDTLRVSEGVTVLSAIHDLTLAAQFAGRLVLLDAGRVSGSGRPAEVLSEGAILDHFGARVTTIRDEAGKIAVVPIRHAHTGEPASSGVAPGE